MSVLIRDMDAPRSCDACPFYDDISRYCDAKNRHIYKADRPKPAWCPVQEVEDISKGSTPECAQKGDDDGHDGMRNEDGR